MMTTMIYILFGADKLCCLFAGMACKQHDGCYWVLAFRRSRQAPAHCKEGIVGFMDEPIERSMRVLDAARPQIHACQPGEQEILLQRL